MEQSTSKLIELFPDRTSSRMLNLLARPVERVLAIDRLNRLYQSFRPATGQIISECMLSTLQAGYRVSGEDLARIPASGPLVVVANHPFGGIEGLVLHALLKKVRHDVKLMANYLLGRVNGLRDDLILVDPFGGQSAARRNPAPLREAIAWVKEGHALGIFPSGTVSHWQPRNGVIADPEWSPTVAGIARRCGAAVLPVYFAGSNRTLFHLAGVIHPRLRTALLPAELVNKSNHTIEVHIGNAVKPGLLERATDDRKLIRYFRFRTYLLEQRTEKAKARLILPLRAKLRRKPGLSDISPSSGPDLITAEIQRLPDACLLLNSGEYRVFVTPSCWISHTLREIGRLREITFRAAGEGTGKSLDLDRFDRHYDHLFVWHEKRCEVVGAYRVGRTRHIVNQHGLDGLYTRTLFRYDQRLMDAMGPALELGRSFVRPEYQRGFAPLMLLWRGIGAYIARHPECVNLFGPVSITNAYSPNSRNLMAQYLMHHEFDPALSPLVRARNPLKLDRDHARRARKAAWIPESLEDLDIVLGETEPILKQVPVLLRQYLKLGGTILGLNVDPDFENALDGLIRVDLRKTPMSMLTRYFDEQTIQKLRAA